MIVYALCQVITHEFEKAVGTNQHEKRTAFHVGFSMRCHNDDQYRVQHMYLYAPMNYVYVAVQEERINKKGDRIVGPMKILCYHDSCWCDALRDYLYENQDEMSMLKSFKDIFGWNDVLNLTEGEADYLRDMNRAERNSQTHTFATLPPLPDNPFDKRGIWAK